AVIGYMHLAYISLIFFLQMKRSASVLFTFIYFRHYYGLGVLLLCGRYNTTHIVWIYRKAKRMYVQKTTG
ncbi:hypothetical protein CGG93_24580, partial [Vibrio parahaemolyticus]